VCWQQGNKVGLAAIFEQPPQPTIRQPQRHRSVVADAGQVGGHLLSLSPFRGPEPDFAPSCFLVSFLFSGAPPVSVPGSFQVGKGEQKGAQAGFWFVGCFEPVMRRGRFVRW
jgi:hypothetical protein